MDFELSTGMRITSMTTEVVDLSVKVRTFKMMISTLGRICGFTVAGAKVTMAKVLPWVKFSSALVPMLSLIHI